MDVHPLINCIYRYWSIATWVLKTISVSSFPRNPGVFPFLVRTWRDHLTDVAGTETAGTVPPMMRLLQGGAECVKAGVPFSSMRRNINWFGKLQARYCKNFRFEAFGRWSIASQIQHWCETHYSLQPTVQFWHPFLSHIFSGRPGAGNGRRATKLWAAQHHAAVNRPANRPWPRWHFPFPELQLEGRERLGAAGGQREGCPSEAAWQLKSPGLETQGPKAVQNPGPQKILEDLAGKITVYSQCWGMHRLFSKPTKRWHSSGATKAATHFIILGAKSI